MTTATEEASIVERVAQWPSLEPQKVCEIRPRELGYPFIAGALTSVVAGAVTIAFGARVGGILLAFPAILAASLTLIAEQDDSAEAREDARGAVVGGLARALFAAAAAVGFSLGGAIASATCWPGSGSQSSFAARLARIDRSVLISTMNDLPGYEIEEVIGEVYGLTVRSRNIGSQLGAFFKSLAGGELKGMTKVLASSRDEVTERVVAEAESRGANAVIAFRFDTSEMGGTRTEICAYGTAVRVRRLR